MPLGKMSVRRVSPEFIRFGLVGVAGFLVDVAVLYLAAPNLGWYVARGVSFLAAATATWWLNRCFTFAARERVGAPDAIWRQYLQYVVSMLGGAAINYTVYVLTLHWLHDNGAGALGVALGSVAGLAVNYLSASRLIFKR